MASGATKEAGIRITLDNKTFVSQVRQTENEVKASSSNMGKALDASLKAGLKGGSAAVGEFFATIKSGIKAFTGIGGIMGGAELVKAGLQTQGIFKGLAFGIRAGTGEAANFRDMMKAGQEAAQKWGKDVDDIGRSMKGIWQETGDVSFVKQSADTIAMVSRASRESIDTLGELSGSLHEKFQISSDDLGDTLGAVLSLGNKGGVTVDELTQRIGFIGSVAREAGMTGTQGFSRMVGLLNVADDGGKNLKKNLSAITTVLTDIGNQGQRAKLGAKLGIDTKSLQGDAADVIGQILKATGGKREKLETAFNGESLAFMLDLGKKYAKTFEETKGDVKTKTAAALAAYTDALNDASKSQLSSADLQNMAAKAMESGPAKMDAALQKMRAAFTRPEIGEAVGKLADVMPPLVDQLAKLLAFVVEHPLQGGAALVGGVAAKGALGAAGGSLLDSGMKSLTAQIAASIGASGGTAGKAASAAIAEGMAAGAPKVGSGIAAAAAPVMANALALATAVAIAAAVSTYSSLDQKSKGHGMAYWWVNAKHNLGITNDEEYSAQRSALTGEDNPYASINGYEEALRRKEAEQLGHAGDEEALGMSFNAEDIANGSGGVSGGGPAQWRMDLMDQKRPSNGAGAASQTSAENAKLLNDMLRGSPLSVKISNPEDVRGGGAGGVGSGPAPGYAPRE